MTEVYQPGTPEHPWFWRVILILVLLSIGSCTLRHVYCDWSDCPGYDPR